jgi:hypothetical protein
MKLEIGHQAKKNQLRLIEHFCMAGNFPCTANIDTAFFENFSGFQSRVLPPPPSGRSQRFSEFGLTFHF